MLLRFQIVCGNTLVALLLAGCGDARELPARVDVQMTGSAYCWEVRQAGWDAEFGTADDVVTRRQLQLPIGVPVRLRLCSDDFIYGVKFAGLDGIAVPGLENSIEFVPDALGEFLLRGNQMCGDAHPALIVTVEVVAQDAFARALSAAAQGS